MTNNEAQKNEMKEIMKKAINLLKSASDNGNKLASYYIYKIYTGMEVSIYGSWFKGNNFTDGNKLAQELDNKNSNIVSVSFFDDDIDICDIKLLKIIDYKKAKKELLRITSQDPFAIEELNTLELNFEPGKIFDNRHYAKYNENKSCMVLRAKIAWAEEFLNDNIVNIDEQKAVCLMESIGTVLQQPASKFLDSIDGSSVLEIKEQDKVSKIFYRYLIRIYDLLEKFIYSESIKVNEDLFNNIMILVSNLKSINELINDYEYAYRKYDFGSNEELEIRKSYPKLTRHNPDGDGRSRIETHIIERADVYKWYFSKIKLSEFSVRSIEYTLLKYETIDEVLNSKEISDLKDVYMDLYIPNMSFIYYYCLLLILNNQYKDAITLYNKKLTRWEGQNPDSIEKLSDTFKHNAEQFKYFDKEISFDEYKKEIFNKIMEKNPIFIYENNLSSVGFKQSEYEKFLLNSKLSTEGKEYLKCLSEGGVFFGFEITKNKEKCIELVTKIADKELQNNDKNKSIFLFLIKLINNNNDLSLNKYYKALVTCERSDKSDYITLIHILYDDKRFSSNCIIQDSDFHDYELMLTDDNFYFTLPPENKLFNESHDRGVNKIVEGLQSYANYDVMSSECEKSFYQYILFPNNYDALKEFNTKIDKIHENNLAFGNSDPISADVNITICMVADVWRNNNSSIMSWFSSKHNRDQQNNSKDPFVTEGITDNVIKEIAMSLKHNETDIDYSKAIEVNHYNEFQKRLEDNLNIATDGNIKIPKILIVRALLYLEKNTITSLNNNNLSRIVNEMLSKYLMIDLTPDSIYHIECNTSDDIIVYPFFNVLEQSEEYPMSSICKYTLIDLFNKSLTYLNYLVEKNEKGEYFYSSHQPQVDEALSLKYALENELHFQKIKEIHAKEKELDIQQAKQDAAIEKEREMLSFLTHTLRNSLANGPAQLKQSIRLLGTDDYDESNSKYKAINNIVSQLSTFSVVNTLITTFKQYVGDQESFKQQWYNDNQGKADIDWVINFCLRQCVSRALFFPNYQRVIKRLIIDNSSAHIKEIRKDYIENILSLADENETSKIVNQWVSTYLPKIKVKIHGDNLAFSINGTKFTYLFSIFSEVIWNAFKHTDKEHSINISWIDTGKGYCLVVENYFIEDEISIESSTNMGLVFINRLLSMFEQTSFEYSKNIENSFWVRINLPYDVFYQRKIKQD